MDISVIMTVYNGERFIEDAINSVLNQKDIDFELVIVDDGSTDGTPRILEQYSRCARVKVISTRHIGRGKALNLAIANAKGEFIANLDSDDLFHPFKLKLQNQVMKDNPHIGVLSTDSIIITNDNLVEFPLINTVSNVLEIENNTKKVGILNPVNHSAALMSKKALEEVGGYDELRKTQLDYDLWIRMAKKSWNICKLKKPLTVSRCHKNQSFETKKRLNYVKSSLKLQLSAITDMKLPKYYYLIAYVRFVYGLLPNRVRVIIKKIRCHSALRL